MIDKFKERVLSFDIRKQERKIVFIFVSSLLLYIAFILYADTKKISHVAQLFDWSLIPLLLGLTVLNYVFRAIRFHFYLREVGINISAWEAFSIFMSGLSMTVTPGKSGEIVKAYLLKRTIGTRFSEVIPLLIFERVTDGIAMILLALGGIFMVQNATLFLILATIFVLLFIAFIKIETSIVNIVFRLQKYFPKVKLLEFATTFFQNAKRLTTVKALTIGIGLGMVAWFFEGLSLAILVSHFTPSASLITHNLLPQALFIFSFSSIAGFFVLIPGGIGVAEGSITYFITSLFHLGLPQAIFITILFRFVTLWFGVSLGLGFLIWYVRSHLVK